MANECMPVTSGQLQRFLPDEDVDAASQVGPPRSLLVAVGFGVDVGGRVWGLDVA